MILDILYKNAPPEQIQNVRMTSTYPNKDTLQPDDAPPVLVIHFYSHLMIASRWIDLVNVHCISTTND